MSESCPVLFEGARILTTDQMLGDERRHRKTQPFEDAKFALKTKA